MRKSLLLLSSVLAGSLMLAGCGNDKDAASGDKKFTIGVTQIVEHPSLDAAYEGFKKALEENGYKEGENVEFDVQNAQNDQSNSQSIAKKLVGDKVDLIFANSTPSALHVLNETKEIPIVFTSVTDPVGAGLVEAFDKPGDNITGTTDTNPDAIPQTVSFMTDEVGAKTIGVIYNSGEQNSEVQVEQVNEIAKEKGVEVVEASISTSAEVKQAAESLVGRVDAIYIPKDNTVVSALESVISVANDKDIPLFVGELDSLKRGGIVASGFDYKDLGYQTGLMAVKILNGDSEPSEIDVEYPEDAVLTLNKKAAEEQGVEVKDEWADLVEFLE
ncbi:ABC transporter substrate-binding protein [Rossellomorea vietnamensis]|uniref:ABC transporter substrate-binding protein n=1 Tax=Rossellomorea vietnamensis TaxID=218284 RepID=A0A5D4MFV9_9BACI|nr:MULTISPECIES: ABC transporter substrate-binding protein [Bacillaceae]TYR99925.1 ABC transporter substrate-binding protein [Rossellomorea vietnamensis]